ncbi:MAG: nucleotidyltransferase domain-containing protein, partial [Gammaproteobacteria bacterium]|nr:nucleotidyltransferase domain-containing protein [Gammaproteobacteria bacterium]
MNATSRTHTTSRTVTPHKPSPAQSHPSLTTLREALRANDQELGRQFRAGMPVEQLLHARAQSVDAQVQRVFQFYFSAGAEDLALAAVGGYGRGILHPYSDIDLLILQRSGNHAEADRSIGAFIAALWDIGLQASHSVRTVEECVAEARADLSVATNLMEARHLAGAEDLCRQLQKQMQPEQLWP